MQERGIINKRLLKKHARRMTKIVEDSEHKTLEKIIFHT
jgi:hypothetical protein